MSANLIDEMSDCEAKDLLNLICLKFGIGEKARCKNTILGNVENSRRRSDCLGRIENYMTVSEIVEGEEHEYSLLNWGEHPDQYIKTFIEVIDDTRRADIEKAAATTNDHHADLLEHLDSKGAPEELANAIETAGEDKNVWLEGEADEYLKTHVLRCPSLKYWECQMQGCNNHKVCRGGEAAAIEEAEGKG